MFRASIICKVLHSPVTCYLTRRLARPRVREAPGTRSELAVNSSLSGMRCAWRRKICCARSYRQVEARPREPSGRPSVRPIRTRAGGGAAGGGGAGSAPPSRVLSRSDSALAAGASLASLRHGAANVAFRRRSGRGRVPGVPEVRLQLGGARRTRTGRLPVAGAALVARIGAGRRPLGLPESVPGLFERLTYIDLSFVFL